MSIREVLQAFAAYYEAERECSACCNQCEYDSGWHCRREIEAASEAADLAELALNEYIDERIAKVIGK